MKSISILQAALRAAAAVMVGFTLTTAVIAQPAARTGMLSVEDVWRLPNLSGLTISSDGKHIAATAPHRGRMNLVVINLDTKKGTLLTNFEDFDVTGHRWIGADRLTFSLGQFNAPSGAGQQDGGGLFTIKRDGSESRKISPTLREVVGSGQNVWRRFSVARRLPGTDAEVIAAGNMEDADATDLYRLNLQTGKYTLLTAGRPAGYTSDWILDSKLNARVVSVGQKDSLTTVVMYRDVGGPWGEIARFDANKGPAFVPLTFDPDDGMLQVATSQGRDTMAVFRFDPKTRKLGEMIAAHPRFDIGAAANGSDVAGVVTDPDTGALLGYSVNGSIPEVVWIDPGYAQIQATLDRALPGLVNSFRKLPGVQRYLVRSYSDVVPNKWYLYDETAKSLEEIGSAKPWLDGKLTKQHPFILKSRDGLEFPGYYFLPPGAKPGQRFPTVVHIHGGPFARADYWGNGFGYSEAQILSARGYAVIVPNFRITTEIGAKNYYAGFGTIGRQMSDDHEDAVKWGVEQGFVDAKRVCISGASYGGYAALWALIRPTNPFACAVAGLAVTDYEYQLTSRDGDTSRSKAGVDYWLSVLGANSTSDQLLKDVSPVNFADKIKQPVYFYSGRDDVRVPIAQIERMVRGMTQAGNPPKGHVVAAKEGHGFGKLENRVSTWTSIVEFLDASIGPKSSP